MAQSKQASDEPSIEEILDSIRQIIAEDEPEEAKVAPVPEPEPELPAEDPFAVEEREEEILDLTEKIEEKPEPEPEKSMEVDLVDIDDQPALASDDEDSESILTDAAESAAYDAITSLVRKTAVEHNGITLEEIVRTELKPMLRGWLDKNLPIIIDRLVREELERVSKRALEE